MYTMRVFGILFPPGISAHAPDPPPAATPPLTRPLARGGGIARSIENEGRVRRARGARCRSTFDLRPLRNAKAKVHVRRLSRRIVIVDRTTTCEAEKGRAANRISQHSPIRKKLKRSKSEIAKVCPCPRSPTYGRSPGVAEQSIYAVSGRSLAKNP
jgi:hypothetical protein